MKNKLTLLSHVGAQPLLRQLALNPITPGTVADYAWTYRNLYSIRRHGRLP